MSSKRASSADSSVPSPVETSFPLTQVGLEDFIETLARQGLITKLSFTAITQEKLNKFQIWKRKPLGNKKGRENPTPASSKKSKPEKVDNRGKKLKMREARIPAMQKIARTIGLIEGPDQVWNLDNEEKIHQWESKILEHMGENFHDKGEDGKYVVPDRKEKILKFLREEAKLEGAENSAALAIFPTYKMPHPVMREEATSSGIQEVQPDISEGSQPMEDPWPPLPTQPSLKKAEEKKGNEPESKSDQ